jgi:hypothetical protein
MTWSKLQFALATNALVVYGRIVQTETIHPALMKSESFDESANSDGYHVGGD